MKHAAEEDEEAPHMVLRSYKLRTRQDNDGKVSINTAHDKGGSSEQVKVICILANEKEPERENMVEV